MSGPSSALENAAMDLDSTSKSNAEPLETIKVEQVSNNNQTTNNTNHVNSAKIGTPMSDYISTPSNEETKATTSNVSAVYGNYEDYQLLPEAPWPPPVFVRQDISPQERYYIEHRWYSQWSFFDSKASENKQRYYRTQVIVGIGSVTVPVLVGINAQGIAADLLYIVTVFISLSVAMATAIEALYTFGDNWRSYRSAAEDLRQEKSLYDVKAGRYTNNRHAFIRFVERCEEIIAQQNGRWVQSQEKAAEQIRDDVGDFLDDRGIRTSTDQFGNTITKETAPTTKPIITSDSAIDTEAVYSETDYSDQAYTSPESSEPYSASTTDPNDENQAPTSYG